MFDLRKYRFGLDVWGLVLFALVMVPNFIWFAVPAPNDVLRGESVTPGLDIAASVFQAGLVGTMCLLRNRGAQRPMGPGWRLAIAGALALYWTGWILYYQGITHVFLLLGQCVTPCLVFACFTAARKNGAALLCALGFFICHGLYGVMNFAV